jgi:hypothetical protein
MKIVNKFKIDEEKEQIVHIKEWRLNRWYEKVIYVIGWFFTVIYLLLFFAAIVNTISS